MTVRANTDPRNDQALTDRGGSQRRAASDYSVLLKRVQAAGLMRRRPGSYLMKIGGLLLALVAVCVVSGLLGAHWTQLGVAVALAVLITQMMFLGHDAAHRQIFRSARANEWTALVLGTGLGGVSMGWWDSKHTRHHRSPNQIGRDPDISSAVLRLYDSGIPVRHRLTAFLYSRQGWWFYPLLIAEAANLHAHSIVTVIARRRLKHRTVEAVFLVLRLGLYPALLFAWLPGALATGFLAVQLAATGLYLGSAFAVSHIGMPTVAKDSKIDFLRRQVLTSRNVSGGRIATMAMGGLNYQIEHHLFPAMARPNLRRARPVVRAFCAEHAIDYHEVPITRAWAIVARRLNRVGLAAAWAVSCPTAAALR